MVLITTTDHYSEPPNDTSSRKPGVDRNCLKTVVVPLRTGWKAAEEAAKDDHRKDIYVLASLNFQTW